MFVLVSPFLLVVFCLFSSFKFVLCVLLLHVFSTLRGLMGML